jgi:hypothetical protein
VPDLHVPRGAVPPLADFGSLAARPRDGRFGGCRPYGLRAPSPAQVWRAPMLVVPCPCPASCHTLCVTAQGAPDVVTIPAVQPCGRRTSLAGMGRLPGALAGMPVLLVE